MIWQVKFAERRIAVELAQFGEGDSGASPPNDSDKVALRKHSHIFLNETIGMLPARLGDTPSLPV